MFVKGKYNDYNATIIWKCPKCGKNNILDFVEIFNIEIGEQTVIYVKVACKHCGEKANVTT